MTIPRSNSWLFEVPPKSTRIPLASAEQANEWENYENTSSWFRKFKEPLHNPNARTQQIDILQKLKECHTLGQRYQQLVAEDLGAAQVQEKFRQKGLRPDIGTGHEVTLEGRDKGFCPRKLAQLRIYLERRGEIMLTVPRLSPAAEKQLKQLGTEFTRKGRKVLIIVRETLG